MFPIDQHLVWACGHAAMLFSAAIILIQTCLFRTVPVALYKFGYLGALLSYCIVILKSLGKPQANIQWIQRAFVDENVQYAVLALYWFVSKPVNLSVLPFATFSLFHCLTFLRQNVLPRFAPKPVAGAAAGAPPPQNWASNYMRTIQVWVKSHYDTAMRFVAFAELAILARVTVGALTSFLAPLFLAHFIRLRFHASPFSRSAVSTVVHRIDGLAAGQGGGIQNGWLRVKGAIASWGGGNLVPAQGGQAGPAQGNAQARR